MEQDRGLTHQGANSVRIRGEEVDICGGAGGADLLRVRIVIRSPVDRRARNGGLHICDLLADAFGEADEAEVVLERSQMTDEQQARGPLRRTGREASEVDPRQHGHHAPRAGEGGLCRRGARVGQDHAWLAPREGGPQPACGWPGRDEVRRHPAHGKAQQRGDGRHRQLRTEPRREHGMGPDRSQPRHQPGLIARGCARHGGPGHVPRPGIPA